MPALTEVCTRLVRRLPAIVVFVLLLQACSPHPFRPVNVGREYGNGSRPLFVSHLWKSNQWALVRTHRHNLFQKILCFNYPCRLMIGRHKALKEISFEDFRKRVRKNARKGVYKKEMIPDNKPIPVIVDTVRISTEPVIDTSTTMPGAGATTSPEEPLTLKADSLITLSDVLFESNSDELRDEHLPELDRLSEFLRTRPTLRISITGHTDNTGQERDNVRLSMRRAESVAKYLVNNAVDDERIFFEGFGSSQPLADNGTPEGRGKNRRVEILLTNGR